ncbi:MAG: shikimate kinase [Chlamydiia bacterium]
MNIILIGFMGSGKSVIGRRLSELLGYCCVDMDELVYAKTDTQDMYEVFAKGGEILLRETEIAIAKEYAGQENLIISTGGGVVLNKIILDYFRAAGAVVIFLDPPFALIAERLQKEDTRPLFQDETSIKKLYDFRHPLYTSYADHIIDLDCLSIEEIALQIKALIPTNGPLHGH